jgi:hypothetical protein
MYPYLASFLTGPLNRTNRQKASRKTHRQEIIIHASGLARIQVIRSFIVFSGKKAKIDLDEIDFLQRTPLYKYLLILPL